MVRVEPAGVGKHPDPGTRQMLGLLAETRLRSIKSGPVRPDSDNCNEARPIASNLSLEPSSSRTQLAVVELGSSHRGARDEIGDAATEREKFALLRRLEPSRCETGRVQGRPEAIAGPREMVSGRRGVQAGVDADEQHIQPGRDDVEDSRHME